MSITVASMTKLAASLAFARARPGDPALSAHASSARSAEAAAGTPQIEVRNLGIKYGEYVAVPDVSFEVRRNEHLTLLGPSGCGKTTTLRSIAGLEQPSAGEIVIDNRTVYSAQAGINVPAEKRGVSMVFQSYAIWPHMTVFENVAYGLRVRRLPRDKVATAVERALRLVQMQGLADRHASKLSGGQQQRVALARAIAFSPAVVLFDEPLSNLDAKLRGQMRVELRELQQELGISSVYVTHDQEEALAISDRIIVMNGGRIEQVGTPEDIYDRPRSRFVADFIGSANLIPICEVIQDGRRIAVRTIDGQVLSCVAPHGIATSAAEVAVRTAYIGLSSGPTTAANQIRGRIRRRMFHGDFIQYAVDWPGGRLEIRRPPTESFEIDDEVYASFAAEHCVLLAVPADA
ncbi:ABC transporter ATP-binding protein [Xanthobacter sediminis]